MKKLHVKNLQSSKMIILDVRTPAEFESAHIKGAFNVPLDLLPEHKQQLQSLKEPVAVVCRSGNRATKACEILHGMPELHLLEGGMMAWEQEGFQVVRGKQLWSLERQVRFAAGALVASGLVLSFLTPYVLAVSAFVAVGLMFSAVTDTCTMGMLLSKLPYNRQTYDGKAIVDAMTSS